MPFSDNLLIVLTVCFSPSWPVAISKPHYMLSTKKLHVLLIGNSAIYSRNRPVICCLCLEEDTKALSHPWAILSQTIPYAILVI